MNHKFYNSYSFIKENYIRRVRLKMMGLNKNAELDLVHCMQDIYLEVYKISNKYLEDYYDDLKRRRIIDIRSIVNKYGINIVERELYPGGFLFINQVDGYLDIVNKDIDNKYTIYVNENLDEVSKRYVIAHEFSHYILKERDKANSKRKKGIEIKYCLNTLFAKNVEENVSDILTSFLLMPIECVLPLMKQFVDDKKGYYPVHVSEWLQCLSYWMQISSYHVGLCFQHIRYLAAFIYDNENKGVGDKIPIKDIKDYEYLFY